MPDEADELILKMQHLEAQARDQQAANQRKLHADRLKTAAQKMAFEARGELEQAEAAEAAAADRVEKSDAHGRVVKARARLNFALDQMDEAERGEWEALQKEAAAETHAQLADDPLLNKP